MKVVALAGGTGGAKLAAGLQELLGTDLTVIANTGDDIEALGVYVSPDPDLCTYWLSDQINEEQGWGIKDDTFTVFERLKQLGAPDWFGLSDRDLATCLERRRRLDAGERLTVIASDLARALGARATVLPMCDEPVRTRVRIPSGWRGFQEYLVQDRAGPPIEGIELAGIGDASITPEVRAAIEGADAIVVGPSNPVISIGPILAVPGISELIAPPARRCSRSARSSPARSSRVRPTSSCGPPAGSPPPPASPPPTRRSSTHSSSMPPIPVPIPRSRASPSPASTR